jgi:hypothetical protein
LLYGLVALGLRRGGDCDAEFLAAATEAAADRLEERRRRDDADANACSSDSSALGLELDACWALAVACARLGHRDPRLLQAIALSVAESVERASAAANVGPSFSSSPSLLTSAKRAAGLAALAEAFAVQRAHSPKLMMALREAFRARNGYLARRLPTAVEASAALWGLFFSFREVDGDHSREDAALAALLGERVAALGPQLPLRQLARVFATLAGVVVGGGGRGTSAASSAAASAAVASLCSSLRPPQLRRMRAAELAAVVVAVSVTLMRRRVEEEQDEEEDEEQQQQPPPPPPPVLLRRFLQDCALAARNRLHTCSPRDLVALLEAFALCGHRSGLLVAYAERTLLVVGTRGGGPASASGAVAVVDSLPLPLLARLAAALAALAAGGGSSADGDETTALSRRSKRRLRAAGGDVERRGEASAAADQERHRRRRRRLAVVSAIARRGVEAVKEVRGGGADEAADDDDAALLLRALVALVGEEEEDEEDDEGEGEGNDDGKDAAAARQLQALADALGDSGFVAPTSSFSSTLDQWRRLLAEQARMITVRRGRERRIRRQGGDAASDDDGGDPH